MRLSGEVVEGALPLLATAEVRAVLREITKVLVVDGHREHDDSERPRGPVACLKTEFGAQMPSVDVAPSRYVVKASACLH